MPARVSMVRNVDALMVEWFGMLRKSEPPIGVPPAHGYVLSLAHQLESDGLKRSNHSGFGSIHRELSHQAEIVASAIKASIRCESSGSTSSPNVSMWNRMADLTSA